MINFDVFLFSFASFRFILFRVFCSCRFVSSRFASSCLVVIRFVPFRLVFCVVFALFRFVSFRLIAAPTNFGLWRTVRYRGSAGKARSRPAPVAGFRGRKPRSQAKQGRQPGVFPYFPFPKNVATTSLLVSLVVVMW